MPRNITMHELQDLAHEETQNEVMLSTRPNTEIHIIVHGDQTIISMPFGNAFDVVNGRIIIHDR